MISTDICSLLNIKYPIIQGGMAWVATGELAASVSEAGGLGIIGAGNAPADIIRKEILKVKEKTDKPFGVNLYYMSPFVEDLVDLVTEMQVPVVTTGAGNPGKHIERFKESNIKVIPVVASIALAKRLERLGVDALIAEGLECGGHVGDLTTMVLVPQIVDAVKIPVIAAGGIADGRGVVAALSLGASGVQIGTRFVCAKECTVHENFKQIIIKAKDRDTILTGVKGHEVRVIKNKLSREFLKLIDNKAELSKIEELGIGKLRLAAVEGDVENGSVMAGQIAALIKEIQPAKEIIEDIINDTKFILDKMTKLL